jgi:hypothetical protein
VNRFIIDPARAYRYFSTVTGCLDYYRRLIRLACLMHKHFFRTIHIREETQDEVLYKMR